MTADGTVAAFDAKGKPLAGFPSPLLGADVGASPLLYDATATGRSRRSSGLPTGALHALRAARSRRRGRAAVPWPAPGATRARSGRYGPNPPAYKDLASRPPSRARSTRVKARWRATWLDAGPSEATPAAAHRVAAEREARAGARGQEGAAAGDA